MPLTSRDGVPHSPRGLLSNLFSLLEEKLNVRYRDTGVEDTTSKDDAGRSTSLSSIVYGHNSPDRPFSETLPWCLGALKNLTRPGKLAPSSIVAYDSSSSEIGEELTLATYDRGGGGMDTSDVVAAHAILDSGILPVLLRALWNVDDVDDDARYLPNTPFDQALSTLMHMTSVPRIRRTLREDHGCVGVLTNIVNRGKETIGDVLLRSKDDADVESMRQLSLQCLKAVSFRE